MEAAYLIFSVATVVERGVEGRGRGASAGFGRRGLRVRFTAAVLDVASRLRLTLSGSVRGRVYCFID